MLGNYIAAAFGNLARNRLYAGVTVAGLAVGFAAAILIGLFIRDECSFERFIPGYQQVYRLDMDFRAPGEPPRPFDFAAATAAGHLALDVSGIDRVARLVNSDSFLRRGDFQALEPMVWADPGFFKLMPLPVLAGDANAALDAPDGIVLTRAMARKYFGEDAPIGRTLLLDPGSDADQGLPPDEFKALTTYHPVRVMAVLEDLPSSTHLNAQVFVSARAPFSVTAIMDRHPSPFSGGALTYLKLKPGVSPARIRAGLPAFADRRYPNVNGGPSALHFRLMPLQSLHFTAQGGADVLEPPGDPAVDAGIAAVGVLILVIAAINFVTLMTARATRRAVEVGVRKAVGARRRDLVLQFMGEALIYVALAMVIGVALAELTLPHLNAFLQRTLRFDYLKDPALPAAILGTTLLTALLAGLYPAVALSSFRPASALRGGAAQQAGSVHVRQGLVVVQFAILIGLIVMTATIYRQTAFALKDALRLDTDQVLRLASPCEPALRQELAVLPGVRGVACVSGVVAAGGMQNTSVARAGRAPTRLNGSPIDVGFFELHGLTPLAGRFFSRARTEDVLLENKDATQNEQPTVVLNESAVRRLGYGSPRDAIGTWLSWARWSADAGTTRFPPFRPSQIVGVVRDFTLASIRKPIEPSIYFVDPRAGFLILIKLDGRAAPDTVRAVDRLWSRTGHVRPAELTFESQAVQALYKDVIAQGAAIAVCAGLAILIASLGLFALAAFTTDRRTKEIGVRKAMGASSFDVVALLLWQFTQPVLWANLIAWPAAWWAMDQWLHGFAYHVDLPPWLFLSAAVIAVSIAWVTVSAQAWLVARARPVTALRYE